MSMCDILLAWLAAVYSSFMRTSDYFLLNVGIQFHLSTFLSKVLHQSQQMFTNMDWLPRAQV